MKVTDAILSECKKLISRHHRAAAASRRITRRFVRSTGVQSEAATRCPPHWALASWFDPFTVRRRAAVVAKALTLSLRDGKYEPRPSLVVNVEKPGGGHRPISIFPVADAALARICFRSILGRNSSRLSPFSYAYRGDISAHDAIERLWREESLHTHHYLVEFDFSKYFDTLDHNYLACTLQKYFKLTRTEQQIVTSILRGKRAFGHTPYQQRCFQRPHRGIPQGNSLSLFLANAACHELDLDLARSGILFARYADDIVAICNKRDDAEHARELILLHCQRAGLAVNMEKSPGITEFGEHGLSSTSTTRTSFDFLGHQFCYRSVTRRGSPARHTVRRLSIRPSTEARIRRKVGTIIFSHLLRYPLGGHFKSSRVNTKAKIDWDLVTCINDLRNYIYGSMPEAAIQTALQNRSTTIHAPRGAMAFFPHITDIEQLKRLDGWLLNAVHSATKRRAKALLTRHGVSNYPLLPKHRLLAADWYDKSLVDDIQNDIRLPSFVRAWKYSRRALSAIDLKQFPRRGIRSADELLYS